MLKAVGNIPNLATACQFISWVHCTEGRLPEALDAIQEAWKHAELGTGKKPWHSRAYRAMFAR